MRVRDQSKGIWLGLVGDHIPQKHLITFEVFLAYFIATGLEYTFVSAREVGGGLLGHKFFKVLFVGFDLLYRPILVVVYHVIDVNNPFVLLVVDSEDVEIGGCRR